MYKMLIVDDEQEIRNGYSKYFPWEQLGFEIVGTAEDGQKALEFMNKLPVDVVLCDIVMPNISGIELAGKIKELGLETKVMVLSGYSDFEYARKAFANGAFDYVLKSDKHQVLVKALEKLKKQLDDEIILPVAVEDYELVDRIKKYILEHYKTVTLYDAAEYVCLSTSYISRLFKDKTGMNFYAYVLKIKLEQAKRLLENPKTKIYDIADNIGYSNSKNFNRIFKKMVGMNPTDYRNHFLNKQ